MIRPSVITGSISSSGHIPLPVSLILVMISLQARRGILIVGSGDLWVADHQGGYQATKSSTYHQINSSWEITYDSSVGACVSCRGLLLI